MSGSTGIRAILILVPSLRWLLPIFKTYIQSNQPPILGGLIQENTTQSLLSFSCNQIENQERKNHFACEADVPAVSRGSG